MRMKVLVRSPNGELLESWPNLDETEALRVEENRALEYSLGKHTVRTTIQPDRYSTQLLRRFSV